MSLSTPIHLFNKESLMIRCYGPGVGAEMKNCLDLYHVHGSVGEMGKWASNYNVVMSSQRFAQDVGSHRGFPEE